MSFYVVIRGLTNYAYNSSQPLQLNEYFHQAEGDKKIIFSHNLARHSHTYMQTQQSDKENPTH